MSEGSEDSREGNPSTREEEDMEQDPDLDDIPDADSGSSYSDSEYEGGMGFMVTRRHHRAESEGNSSNTDYVSDDGYYGTGWGDPEDEEEREEAEVPEPPRFDKLKSLHPKHKHETRNFPEGFAGDDLKDALKMFQLFISDDTLAELAAATNAYATKSQTKNAQWTPTSVGELKVFLGTILYMGMFQSSDVGEFWESNWMMPQYPIKNYISESRFRGLLEYFHAAPPDISDDEDWHGQLEPLGAKIREASMRYYLPGVELSLDRTKDLNIFSLNHYSYTWNFLFYKDTPPDIPELEGLSFPVFTNAYLLASSLPKESHRFEIITNKHFTNVPLFSALRKIGIGAVGQATWNREGFPETLQELQGKYIPWGIVTGALAGPDNDVLGIVWRHFATARMLTTIHEITPVNRTNYGKSESYKNPCPPRDQPIVDAAFGGQKRAMLDQPRAGLEIAEYADSKQHLFTETPRERFYTRQLSKEPVVKKREWLMGLVWLLDVAVVNANVVSKQCGGKRDHVKFRTEVVNGLLKALGDPLSGDPPSDRDQGGPSVKRARVV